jgi:hypothetical protein
MFLSTREVARGESADLWHSLVSEAFVPMKATVPGAERFRGRIVEHQLGSTQISSVLADPHTVTRTRSQAASSDCEYLKLSTPLRGGCVVVQDGKQVALEPGDLTVYDTTKPFTLSFDETSEMLVMLFPPQALSLPRAEFSPLLVERFSGRHGVGTLVSPLLKNLVEHFDEIDVMNSHRLASNVLDIVAVLFAERLQRPVARSSNEQLVIRAQNFIENHLEDADLGPERVAATVHISVSYLHRLFNQDGKTVARYILQRRLERCRRCRM